MKNIVKKLLLLTPILLLLLIPQFITGAVNIGQNSDRPYGYILESDYASIMNLPIKHDVIVAIIDSGINYNNPYIRDSVIGGYDYIDNDNDPMDSENHGTGIAGIIGGKKNDYINVSGLFPGVKILNLRAVSDFAFEDAVANSIRYAVDNGAKIINCSLGFSTAYQVLIDAIEYADSKGVIIVGSAGNLNREIDNYPASHPKTISVSGLNTSNERRLTTATYGETVDYSTQGSFDEVLQSDGTYSLRNGTSYSSAVMSAVIARLLAYDDSLTKSSIISLLDQDGFELPILHGRKIGRKLNVTSLVNRYVTLETKMIEMDDDRNNVVLEIEIAKEGSAVIRKVLKYAYVNGRRYSLHKEMPCEVVTMFSYNRHTRFFKWM